MADEKTVCIVTQNTHVQSFYHIFDSILLINHKLICFTFKNKTCVESVAKFLCGAIYLLQRTSLTAHYEYVTHTSTIPTSPLQIVFILHLHTRS